ncbi:MAG: hypothetical protein EXR70_21545 [Deltaproteobacteria bacterium]|nr:hypothetical protein [Deltaproteobacteria bacterium]
MQNICQFSNDDPIAPGLVASFARPGGSLTGVSALETELSGKQIDVLKESLPKLSSVAARYSSDSAAFSFYYSRFFRRGGNCSSRFSNF